MRTRSRVLLTTIAAVVLACVTFVAPSTAGAATVVDLAAGTTSVTSSPGVTAALLRNGILPLPPGGASEGLVLQPGGLGVKASFPVTGGSVDADTLAGTVTHKGGLVFVSLAAFKTVTI